jgi:hypothetical protein
MIAIQFCGIMSRGHWQLMLVSTDNHNSNEVHTVPDIEVVKLDGAIVRSVLCGPDCGPLEPTPAGPAPIASLPLACHSLYAGSRYLECL